MSRREIDVNNEFTSNDTVTSSCPTITPSSLLKKVFKELILVNDPHASYLRSFESHFASPTMGVQRSVTIGLRGALYL